MGVSKYMYECEDCFIDVKREEELEDEKRYCPNCDSPRLRKLSAEEILDRMI